MVFLYSNGLSTQSSDWRGSQSQCMIKIPTICRSKNETRTLHTVVKCINTMTWVHFYLSIVKFCHIHNCIQDLSKSVFNIGGSHYKKKLTSDIFFLYLFDFFILLACSTRQSTALELPLQLNYLSVCGFSLFSNPMLKIF